MVCRRPHPPARPPQRQDILYPIVKPMNIQRNKNKHKERLSRDTRIAILLGRLNIKKFHTKEWFLTTRDNIKMLLLLIQDNYYIWIKNGQMHLLLKITLRLTFSFLQLSFCHFSKRSFFFHLIGYSNPLNIMINNAKVKFETFSRLSWRGIPDQSFYTEDEELIRRVFFLKNADCDKM